MLHMLVPTDFSNNAYNALFYGTQLFAAENCTFYLINTYTELTPLRTPKRIKKKGNVLIRLLEEQSEEGLQEVYHKIVRDNENPKHRYQLLSKQGNLLKGITDVVLNKSIDIIIAGNKGHSKTKEFFWGSNTIRMITQIKDCPILTIPAALDFEQPKKIAFVTDYKHPADASLLKPVLELISTFELSLQLMHINEEEHLNKYQESNRNTLLKYFSNGKPSLHWMPYYGSKAAAIHLFLEELKTDLLTMVYNEHSFLEKLLREPVIKEVNLNLKVPFLILKENN